ncbi:MAG: right-handed parallel beta-helix repeat-containing protein [Aigarchaeota archaeon]|nr:right-handed parallel beta-helix repeat-containing protein [Candidatus Pelearchaeum maunauluense]
MAVIVLAALLSPYLALGYFIISVEEPWWSREVTSIESPPKPAGWRVLTVSRDGEFSSISDAVDAARPGDRIVIQPGIYRESVIVENKPWIVIEGVSRDDVILEGGNRLGNGIYVVFSPHITIANLTVQNYLGNGIFYVNSDYFMVFNVKALNNRVYGVNFLASEKGIVSNVIAAGSGDSGIYVGEVTEDCECVVEYSEVYNNTLGYSGTRANGVTIRYSKFYGNAVGIAPNTLMPDLRLLLTGRWPLLVWASNNVIEHNIIENNNNRWIEAAGFAESYGVPVGVGIALIGSHSNVIRNNTIRGHERWGIAEWYFLVPPIGNRFSSNIFSGNGADYWRDGWGFWGCSELESASGDVPPACSLPPALRVSLPNPLKHVELLTNLEIPSASVVAALALGVGGAYAAKRSTGAGAPRGRRISAAIVDALVAGDIYLALAAALMVGGFGITDPRSLVDAVLSLTLLLLPLAYFLWATSWVIYGVLLETLTGATLGKRLFKLQTEAQHRPRRALILVKNIARYVDILLFGLVGVILLLTLRRSFGELVSGTRVVER